jgi:hypothetical protein
MRRKVLQDLANTICQMMVGWRMVDDYEILAELPDGTLSFNLLSESVTHDSGAQPKLWITGELAAWLQVRLVAENIDAKNLVEATLNVSHKTDRIKTARKSIISFDFDCHSLLATTEKLYEGRLVERHIWHKRIKSSSNS